MSAFEDFVQLELPKRPYLEVDPAQETVIVRRGPGPRQLGAVTLTEGQVLGFSGGALVGVTAQGLGTRKFTLVVTIPADPWVVPHGMNSTNVIVQVVDAAGYVIIPDEIHLTDGDVVTISFGTAQTGTARLLFLD